MASMFAAQVSTAKCKIYAIDVTHEARFRKVDKVVHNVGVGDSNLLAAPTGNVAEFLETASGSLLSAQETNVSV